MTTLREPRPGRSPAAMTALLAAGSVIVGACSSSGHGASPPSSRTTVSTAAVTSSLPATTSTTAYRPIAPQTTPDAAAARLISAWAAGDRTSAAQVAAPAAVTAVFASAYPSGRLQPRGCTDASTNPGTCTYRDTSTDALFEMQVQDGATGWYVLSVTVES